MLIVADKLRPVSFNLLPSSAAVKVSGSGGSKVGGRRKRGSVSDGNRHAIEAMRAASAVVAPPVAQTVFDDIEQLHPQGEMLVKQLIFDENEWRERVG